MKPCKLIYLTNISVEVAAYSFRVRQEAGASIHKTLVPIYTKSPWRCRLQTLPKRLSLYSNLDGVISQKTGIYASLCWYRTSSN